MSIETMIQSFDSMFDPAHALSAATLAEYIQHPSEHAELLSNAADDLYEAITVGLAALQRLREYGSKTE